MFNVFAPGPLGVPFVVLLAVVTGLFTLVPLVGRSIIYLCIAGVFAVQAASTDPALLWYPLVFVQQIRPVLAHPDRERTAVTSGPTLAAYAERPGDEADTDSEGGTPGYSAAAVSVHRSSVLFCPEQPLHSRWVQPLQTCAVP